MIFLDNAATTKMYDEINKEISKYNSEYYYNPSSLYSQSLNISNAINNARAVIANFLGANGGEITFTSGATEGNNIIINGVITNRKNAEYIFSMGEHPSVYNKAKDLAAKGYKVNFVNLNKNGTVDVDHLRSLVNQNTVFVSCMHVSNETGVINNIKQIVSVVKAINPKTLVHSDGVQAVGKIYANVKDLGVDFYTISAHKMHGPKGVGAIYVKSGINLKPLVFGGSQENSLRPGTENVAGIMGFKMAAEMIGKQKEANYKKVEELNYTFTKKVENIKDLQINSLKEVSSPYIISISIKGIRGEILLHMLEEKDILINTGSACSSKTGDNRILSAMGIPLNYVKGSVRISFSELNTLKEVEKAADEFVKQANALKLKM